MQVEPIMTTPIELCKRFGDENAVPPTYKILELSVQMLADAQNIYGGLREVAGENLWVGCPLVIHRRCIEPMFSMSNNIAYNKRMFCKTQNPSSDQHFLLEKSIWFNVNDKEVGNKDHTVQSQIDLVASLMEKAVRESGGFPDIYIITPFTSVKRSLERKLHSLFKEHFSGENFESINKWINESCGTIHTFQGKEAAEVLLVLGCDNEKGLAAARWVGKKPNIINVAVSRAKYRVGVIGSFELWCKIPHVQIICDMLKDSIIDI